MKKILLGLLICFSVSVSAQENTSVKPRKEKTERSEKDKGRIENRFLEDFKELNLTEKQQNQLKLVFEAERKNMEQSRSRFNEGEMPSASEMREMREKMKAKMVDFEAKMKTILTEEQFNTWKAKQQERMQQFMLR